MTAPNGNDVRVHVAPDDHPWRDPIAAAVARGGGTAAAAVDDATALVWLTNRAEDGLRDLLHDRIGWVQLRSAGVERWVTGGVLDRDRRWTAARGAYADSVAEHALALILAGLKLLPTYARATTWDAGAKDQGLLLRGRTVAVVGAGGIGQELIRYLRPLGAHVIAVTRSGREVEGADENLAAHRLDEVWPRAQVVVVGAPATDDTQHLVGAAELAAMPSDALLVNIARGSLVDTDALVEALRRGDILGAALDVTDPEPLPDGHPLWSEDRALITPHAANPGSAQLERLCHLVEENVRRLTAGEQLHGVVDLDAGY
jgi:phosphoglycerate dehydrogenase-like enzyme